DHGKENQRADLPWGRRIREKAEGGAAILQMGQAKEAGDDLYAVMERDSVLDEQFCQAVENHHEQRDQEMNFAHARCLARRQLPTALKFSQDGAATFANRRIVLVFSHVNGVIPATIAFLALRLADADSYCARAIARLLL